MAWTLEELEALARGLGMALRGRHFQEPTTRTPIPPATEGRWYYKPSPPGEYDEFWKLSISPDADEATQLFVCVPGKFPGWVESPEAAAFYLLVSAGAIAVQPDLFSGLRFNPQ